jgi:hypothetical protein
MILFHERLPCSENFFRYFKNYDKYMQEKQKTTTTSGGDHPMSEPDDVSSHSSSKQTRSPVRQIESPKYGLGLSVIDKFMNIHSPTALSPTG